MGEWSLTENVELKMELKIAMAKYRYARVFLEYLEAAKGLLALRSCLSAVESARILTNEGRDVHRDYTEDSVAMERVLNTRRTIENPFEGLEYAVGRFDIDLDIAETKEAHYWRALVDAVNSVPNNEAWKAGPWYEGSMSNQHDLLTADEHAVDRISHYQRELESTLFQHTPSPDSLEVDFRLSFGKLIEVVPFHPSAFST